MRVPAKQTHNDPFHHKQGQKAKVYYSSDQTKTTLHVITVPAKQTPNATFYNSSDQTNMQSHVLFFKNSDKTNKHTQYNII